jgi:hypothetical protein
MGFATDADAVAFIAPMLGKDPSGPNSLPARHLAVIAQCLAQAQADITRILTTRGYPTSQVEAWDDVKLFHLRQTVFWSLTGGAIQASNTQTSTYAAYDCRKELVNPDFLLLINGKAVYPNVSVTDAGGAVYSGMLDAQDVYDELDQIRGSRWPGRR